MTDKKMITVFHYDNGRCGSEPYRYEELRRGEWIGYKCSLCGFDWDEVTYEPPSDYMSYCPNCGAKMK